VLTQHARSKGTWGVQEHVAADVAAQTRIPPRPRFTDTPTAMARTRLPVFALACIALLVSAMGQQQQQQQQPGAASSQQMAQPSSGAGANNDQASSSSDMQAVQPDQGVLNFAAQQVSQHL
jgi:hypothetical protein